jgi:hypothetical protein
MDGAMVRFGEQTPSGAGNPIRSVSGNKHGYSCIDYIRRCARFDGPLTGKGARHNIINLKSFNRKEEFHHEGHEGERTEREFPILSSPLCSFVVIDSS